jgi:hypothetical protein
MARGVYFIGLERQIPTGVVSDMKRDITSVTWRWKGIEMTKTKEDFLQEILWTEMLSP